MYFESVEKEVYIINHNCYNTEEYTMIWSSNQDQPRLTTITMNNPEHQKVVNTNKTRLNLILLHKDPVKSGTDPIRKKRAASMECVKIPEVLDPVRILEARTSCLLRLVENISTAYSSLLKPKLHRGMPVVYNKHRQ